MAQWRIAKRNYVRMSSLLTTLEPSKHRGTSGLFDLGERKCIGEVVLGTFRNTRWTDDRGNELFNLGVAYVSTHKVYWHDEGFTKLVCVELAQWITFQVHNSILRRVHRVDVTLREPPTSGSIMSGSARTKLRLELHNNDSKEFKRVIESALSKKLWTRKDTNRPQMRQESFTSRGAGVAGIMHRQAQERAETKRLAEGAFEDLQALMGKAESLVKVIERYSSILEKRKKETGANDSEQDEFNALLNDIGIVNPVTKRSSGSRYHEELARELSAYLQRSLSSHSKAGMITLADLYCIANRARGSDLVSPNDMYQACSLFARLRLPFVLKKLRSGVLVVQSSSQTDETILEKVKELMVSNEYKALSSTLLARELSISIALAYDHLCVAEAALQLCRDETIQETWFYPNRFMRLDTSWTG